MSKSKQIKDKLTETRRKLSTAKAAIQASEDALTSLEVSLEDRETELAATLHDVQDYLAGETKKVPN